MVQSQGPVKRKRALLKSNSLRNSRMLRRNQWGGCPALAVRHSLGPFLHRFLGCPCLENLKKAARSAFFFLLVVGVRIPFHAEPIQYEFLDTTGLTRPLTTVIFLTLDFSISHQFPDQGRQYFLMSGLLA